MAAAHGFYAGNALTAYPFLAEPAPVLGFPSGSAPWPSDAVVEFLADLAPEAGWRPSAHVVRLVAVARAAGVVTFEFAATAPGLAGSRLRFAVAEADVPWTTVTASSVEAAGGCGGEALWAGVLVVGRLAGLLSALPDGATATGAIAVEPTLVRSRAASLRAVVVANVPRTTTDPSGSSPIADLDVAAACVTGDVRFVAGHNVALSQDVSAAALTIDAAVGAGAGVPCAEVPTRPGETPPVPGGPLSGGPTCREVVTSISGVEGRAVKLKAGAGVAIGVSPVAPHVVTIAPAEVGAAGCGEGSP